MTYTQYGPWTDGSSPGVAAEFLNPLETFLLSLNSAAYDTHVSSNGAGLVSMVALALSSATSISGTTAGTATVYQFLQGPINAFFLYFNGYKNTTSTEQTITLPNAFTARAIWVAGGGIPQTSIWSGGSRTTGKVNVMTSFPSGAGNAGSFSNGNVMDGYSYGEITSGFNAVGLGTSSSITFTSGVFVIGV